MAQERARQFPLVAVTGPRQSGKTTLVQAAFPDKPYLSLEDPDTLERALVDPRGLFGDHPEGAILDEIQRAPELFSYLQGIVDRERRMGHFILTGSRHFLMMEGLSQTLAGRVSILHLLPFCIAELQGASMLAGRLEQAILAGMYPPVHDRQTPPGSWYPAYIETFVERDVRQIRQITDLSAFRRFVRFCAARTGQILNLSSLANDCGITHNTAGAWISLLEASYVLFLLRPHHVNFNKRLIKSPKLYFYDTGLVCSLLGIETADQVATHPLRGGLFETFVVSELIKIRFNAGRSNIFHFWRDKTGHEIDLVWERANRIHPLEIKSGATVTGDFFKNLRFWNSLAGSQAGPGFLVYGGDTGQTRDGVRVLGWRELPELSGELL